MKITVEDINGLKQLDRIEYRQKYKIHSRNPNELSLDFILVIVIMISGLLIAIFDENCIYEATAIVFSALFLELLVICNMFHSKYTEGKNIEKLNKEYFKIEKIK